MASQQTSGEWNESITGTSTVIVGISKAERNMESRQRRQIHRVPQQARLKNPLQQYIYDPMMVSLGPYHHGKPHLQQMEEFKRETLAMFLVGSGRDKGYFYSMILERIDDVRSCYIGVMPEEYDDATLSEMMLHDACFVIYYMNMAEYDVDMSQHVLHHIGLMTASLMESDMDKLENQIPYWVIKLLICSRFGEDEGKDLIRNYLSETCFGALQRLSKIPWEEGEDPLHLLEANQRVLAQMVSLNSNTTSAQIIPQIFKFFRRKNKEDISDYEILSRQFHSVTHLKAKGIHFKPSSCYLKDICFKSHVFYGELMLPVLFVNPTDKVFFSNMIAFELSPGDVSDFAVTSYVNFMKRLIESPRDVKELRENGILFSNLAADEEVVGLFQEIDTMGLYLDFFDNVKMDIKEHCRHKSKTWIAELINTNFRSPWTVIALLAAIFLLVLTFLQTYYTIRAA